MEGDSEVEAKFVTDIEARNRSAEAESDAANIAAGNQDLQEPALRLLWNSRGWRL